MKSKKLKARIFSFHSISAPTDFSARLREKAFQYNMPVRIGRNCRIGAGALILPGVTIGDNTVIGAGSVVTQDIPANVVAVGNPCRVMREIGERDREFYFKDCRIDYSDPNVQNAVTSDEAYAH